MFTDQIKWAIEVLNREDYQLSSHVPDIVQENPWAMVVVSNQIKD